MTRPLSRLIAIVAALVLGTKIRAQAVILPTIRANKTPEVTLLNQMIRLMQQPESKPRRLVLHPGDTTKFGCDLGALALTPYTRREIEAARKNADSAIAFARARDFASYRRLTSRMMLPSVDRDSVVQLRNSLIGDFLTTHLSKRGSMRINPDGLAEILASVPVACGDLSESGQVDVRRIVRPYLADETDINKHQRLDSLERVGVANVIQRELRDRNWFAARSHDEATAFWRQPAASALNIGAISGGGDQGATYTELTSRFLHALRLSFNTVIASGKDSTLPSGGASTPTKADATKSDTGASGTAISRFLNGGGLLNVAAAYPVIHYGQSDGSADFLGVFAPRFGGTLPVLGASQRDTTLMYDAGGEFMFKSADAIGGVGLYFQTRIGWAGGSPSFMRLIGDGGRQRTGYQTVTGGIALDDRFLVTMSRTVSGPHSLQATGWQLGVSLARSAASPTTTPAR